MSNNEQTMTDKEIFVYGELQLELMKMIAEENHEKYLEYDRATDRIVLSEIRNGNFYPLEIVEGFISKRNMVLERIYENDKPAYRLQIQRCLARASSKVFELRYVIPGEGPRWYRMYLMSVADESGYVTKFAARMVNIQEQKEAEAGMRIKAEIDALSGVYNHATYKRLCSELADRVADGLLFLMIDVDNFRQINAMRGHHAGDEVIEHVGRVLSTAVSGRGYAGRIGGDEFSVCFYDVYSSEEAMAKCISIKSALHQFLNMTPFTVSIGASISNGRKMTFQELYYEADEAVYFAKENGMNQIIFKDEIQKIKQERTRNIKNAASLTEEEIALDQKMEYITIVDPVSKRILYMNEAGRNALGVTLKDVQDMRCYKLFKGCDKECEICELHANHAQVLEGESAAGLEKYIPQGKFIIQSRYTMWKGVSARTISFMDVNDTEHVERCLEADMESNETFSKCWSLIMESNSGDTEYEKILHVLTDYYDADCCAMVTKIQDKYNELFEYHKNSGNGVAEGLRSSLTQDLLERCEVLLDEEDFMRPRHIDEKLMEFPELASALEQKFVHNTVGIALRKFGEIIGVLMVINPRRNMTDYTMLSRLGVFFSTDLIRKQLTDNKTFEEEHDVLTRLWSREFYNNSWKIDYLPIFKNGMGVFTADIFQLKEINRQLGYAIGNERLKTLADLLRKVFTGYSMFRYDDDQVMAICHNVDRVQFEKMVDYAKELLAELDFEVSRGYSWKAEPMIPDAIEEAEEYLKINRDHLERENATQEKLKKKVENDVLQQVREGNFRMFLQPKVSISKEKTVGAEGLIRLYHPEKGYIPPGMFIPLLEQQNEVHLVDMFILSRAFQFQKAARDAGREIVPISVNFSKNTLTYPHLLEYIHELSEQYGAPNGMIRIEITETISNMDHMEVSNIANALHDLGFSISMDDFGTKYSNMAVLTQFEFDTVKIDRSMIMDIVGNVKNQKVLKHTVEMLKDLGMEIVIEGVETSDQVTTLKELGCDIVQGYYFGKPEPEEQFYELFMK